MGKYGLPEPSAKISIASARMRDIRRRFLDRFTRSQTGRTDSILDTTQESPLTISVNTFELPDNAVSASTASAGALVENSTREGIFTLATTTASEPVEIEAPGYPPQSGRSPTAPDPDLPLDTSFKGVAAPSIAYSLLFSESQDHTIKVLLAIVLKLWEAKNTWTPLWNWFSDPNGLNLIVQFDFLPGTQATDACDVFGGVEQPSRVNPDLTSLANLYFDKEKDRQVLNSLVTKGDNAYKLPGDLYYLEKEGHMLARFTGDLKVVSRTLSFKFDLTPEPQ